jgi:hypothetical protein
MIMAWIALLANLRPFDKSMGTTEAPKPKVKR